MADTASCAFRLFDSLKGDIAGMKNSGAIACSGSISAALFLREFHRRRPDVGAYRHGAKSADKTGHVSKGATGFGVRNHWLSCWSPAKIPRTTAGT